MVTVISHFSSAKRIRCEGILDLIAERFLDPGRTDEASGWKRFAPGRDVGEDQLRYEIGLAYLGVCDTRAAMPRAQRLHAP